MKRLLLALPLAACATAEEAPPTGVTLRTVPEKAHVRFEDGTTCTTPCRAEIAEPIGVTIAKAGYEPVRTDVAPSAEAMLFTLVPVGRSQDVEEEALPEL
ncbi:PEGA domain-containing protein [Parvularcula dongshanensis]|uniref:PEGA domain-containing protein n=1 Tax=Parvularcula dongshanensis TaxID=1173995 RepID=A0A840I364_9PROT|nr:PEGA domain-containing protein [Parvularcula dongshanensis]MBB4658713.1 hypothetical protein [Parvularcula dongshanensis]